ncbi:EamA family transporter [Pseudochryseolinea flava]|uniref:EamA family transporter n=1 Tax=Pseudochryseolinea flava TaxID=2059302 RepID=A0A364Y101_9BACT|nr:EamA family transporter [Pseudochryseolinea flava]RAW00288.1 EamA family transporter [Pseudochryseolinea flava]
MNHQRRYGAAISAFVIWGFFSIPLRALREHQAGEILYFRILFSMVVLLAAILIFRRKSYAKNVTLYQSLTPKLRRQTIFLTLSGGALLTINWLTFIYIVNNINIKTASFSYLICPVITAVLGYILLQERMQKHQWVAVGLCTISCMVMAFSSTAELGYSVLTAFTYALYLISQRKNQGFDRIIVLGIQVLFALIVLSFFYPYLVGEMPQELFFYGVILIIAILFTVIPLFLNLYALNKINAATIGILMYLNPIINFTVAFVVFKEQATQLQWIGYGLIVVALVIFNYKTFVRNTSFEKNA